MIEDTSYKAAGILLDYSYLNSFRFLIIVIRPYQVFREEVVEVTEVEELYWFPSSIKDYVSLARQSSRVNYLGNSTII